MIRTVEKFVGHGCWSQARFSLPFGETFCKRALWTGIILGFPVIRAETSTRTASDPSIITIPLQRGPQPAIARLIPATVRKVTVGVPAATFLERTFNFARKGRPWNRPPLLRR